MRTFDLNGSERRSRIFSDVCMTQCSSLNRPRRVGPKTSVPFRKINEDSGGSVSCNAQPNCKVPSFTLRTALPEMPFVLERRRC